MDEKRRWVFAPWSPGKCLKLEPWIGLALRGFLDFWFLLWKCGAGDEDV